MLLFLSTLSLPLLLRLALPFLFSLALVFLLCALPFLFGFSLAFLLRLAPPFLFGFSLAFLLRLTLTLLLGFPLAFPLLLLLLLLLWALRTWQGRGCKHQAQSQDEYAPRNHGPLFSTHVIPPFSPSAFLIWLLALDPCVQWPSLYKGAKCPQQGTSLGIA
ncbi:MAG TPA: hypothetical protein VKP58_12455 [Candidatus Acidoferrum sp.]|nr:hypothetical protein [Candidatus Acidoferrum sp.]